MCINLFPCSMKIDVFDLNVCRLTVHKNYCYLIIHNYILLENLPDW